MFFIQSLKRIAYYTFADFKGGRIWGVFCQWLFNLIPDFLGAAFVRPYALWMSGTKFRGISTCVIRKNVFIEIPSRLKIGKRVQINRGSYIDSSGEVIIGDFVRIAMDCKVLSMSHSGSRHEIDEKKLTIIKNYIELYAGVIVLPGAIIEDYVVVNAGSVISGATKRGGIYAGNPARLLGFRTDIEESA